jgi:hypothetical protein
MAHIKFAYRLFFISVQDVLLYIYFANQFKWLHGLNDKKVLYIKETYSQIIFNKNYEKTNRK